MKEIFERKEPKMFDMKKQLMWSKLKVGIVLTLAFLTLFLAVFFAGNIEEIFSPKIILTAQIKDVKGLRKGAPVWFSGIEIGSIKSINLDQVHGISVIMSISKSAQKYIKKDSAVTVLTMGLLGDKYVELSIGSPQAETASPGDTLKGSAQIDLQDIVESTAMSIEKITSLISKIEMGEGTLSKFITDPAVYYNLKETTKTLSEIMDDIKAAKGTAGLLLEDPSLYNRMLAATASMEEFTTKLNQSSGTVKRLIEDPALYETLTRASLQLSTILENIEKGNGVAGTLLKDKDLARELKEAVSELKELTKDIKEHPKKYFKFSLF